MSNEVTTGTAARIAKVHENTLVYWIKKGWIKGRRNSDAKKSWWLINSPSLHEHLARRLDAAVSET